MGAQKNRLIEMVLLSTHKHMFWLRIKKINFQICTLIWRPEKVNFEQKHGKLPKIYKFKTLILKKSADDKNVYKTGPQIRVCNWKLFFLFLNQNICCGYSEEPSRWDGSFEHPKHMFKLMDKKIITILR